MFACDRTFEGSSDEEPDEDHLSCLCPASLRGCITCARLFMLSDRYARMGDDSAVGGFRLTHLFTLLLKLIADVWDPHRWRL